MAQDTGPMFALNLNGEKLPSEFVFGSEFGMTARPVFFVFVLDREASAKTRGLDKYRKPLLFRRETEHNQGTSGRTFPLIIMVASLWSLAESSIFQGGANGTLFLIF